MNRVLRMLSHKGTGRPEPKAVFLGILAMLLGLLQSVPSHAQKGQAQKGQPQKGQTQKGQAQPPVKQPDGGLSLSVVSLEVKALLTLHDLDLTKSQLEKLRQVASGASFEDEKRKPGKASKEYRDNLLALRKALTEGKEDRVIGKLHDELEALGEKEDPTLDDDVELTDIARKRTPEAFRLLHAGQLAAYIAHIADDIVDPVDRLIKAFEDVRDMTDAEWKEQRSEIAEEIGSLVAGLDAAKAKKFSDETAALLTKARSVSKTEFPTRQAELSKAAHKVIGDVKALDVIRHHVELDLAHLLSNPRLPQAVQARLKLAK